MIGEHWVTGWTINASEVTIKDKNYRASPIVLTNSCPHALVLTYTKEILVNDLIKDKDQHINVKRILNTFVGQFMKDQGMTNIGNKSRFFSLKNFNVLKNLNIDIYQGY